MMHLLMWVMWMIFDWSASIDNEKAVSDAYLDLAKAFDTVSNIKLLATFNSYSIITL